MARYNDRSPHPAKWTNAKLIERLTETANLQSLHYQPRLFGETPPEMDGDSIREVTRLYRDSWMQPIIDEIAKRFVKAKP